MMKRMDRVTEDFLGILAEMMSYEMYEEALSPYETILTNLSYVLPYSKEQLVEKFNEQCKKRS